MSNDTEPAVADVLGDPYDHRGDAEKTAIVEEAAAEQASADDDFAARLDDQLVHVPGPDFPAGPGRSVDDEIQASIERRLHPLAPPIEDLSEQALTEALRDGARNRMERAAVHLALAADVLTRPDLRAGYLSRVSDGEVRVEWRLLHEHLLQIPLSSGEEAALRVACSLAGQGMPVDLAACLPRMDATLRLAASGAMRRALLRGAAAPEPS